MRQTKLFSKTTRETPKDELSSNARLLTQAGFIRKEMAGVYTFLPLGIRVLNKIERIIKEEMEKVGGQEILMPTLQAKAKWEQTKRYEIYDTLFKFKSFYSKIDYVLGPTHEEVVTPLMQQFIFSYKDLPQAVFQIQNKFRDEKRAKSGILRGREFLMKDLYSFHATEEDMEKYYEVMKEAYTRIFEKAGIGAKTFLTFASGGTFSKYSHEFQTLTLAGEDSIYLCSKCKVAVNQEIIEEQKVCPQCTNKDLSKEKAIEVGNIFKLKTKFSDAFNFKFKDEKGATHPVLMGCYGIGLNRLMGTIVEVFNDEKGIVWPDSVAPFDAHLLSFEGGEKEAEKLYEQLQKQGIEVLYDDRKATPGEKMADADLIGIPWRIIVSAKTIREGRAEIKRRDTRDVKMISLDEVAKLIYA